MQYPEWLVKLFHYFKRGVEGAKTNYKFVELTFKFASWLLTLVGLQLAAEASHSTILHGFSYVLALIIGWPIVQCLFPFSDPVGSTKYKIYVIGGELSFSGVISTIIYLRVDAIVKAIIAGRHLC